MKCIEPYKWKNRVNIKKDIAAYIMVSPLFVCLSIFLFIPLGYVIFISFMKRGAYGNILLSPTFENYFMILQNTYFKIVVNSLEIAFFATILCILIGYPLAYYIANKSKKSAFLILLIMLPFCTSSLVRNYSWVILMNTSGIVNTFLQMTGLIKEPLQLLYNDGAVMMGIVYAFFPFAVLPIYSSIEKLDFSLVEAAKDLGARPWQVFFKIILPLTSSGVFAAVIMIFIPSLGVYFISDLLGGGKSMMIGNLIRNQFLQSNNWPFGAAISLALIIITLIILFIYIKVGGDLEDLGGRDK